PDRHPLTLIQAGSIPLLNLKPRIIVLTKHEIRRANGTRTRLPGVIGYDSFRAAILISHLQLREQSGDLSKKLVATVADMAAVPAVGQQRAECVLAPFQQSGDLISLITHALAIIGPVRSKHVVSHPLPVDVNLVKPQGGCI